VGVATVTHGPALVNTVTALAEGTKGRIPLVLLAGDTDARDRTHTQNIDQREFATAAGAGFEPLRAPETAAYDLAVAFRRARLERRPIVFNMPSEFQEAEAEQAPSDLFTAAQRGGAPTGEDLDNAIGILAAARAPIILAGRGAIGAREPLIRLAERTGALLGTTLKARGLFAGESFNLGVFGMLSTPAAVEAILRSDCIVAFGAGLNAFTTMEGSFVADRRLIQVDADPIALGQTHAPDAALVADAGAAAETFLYWLDEAEIAPSGFRTPEIATTLGAAPWIAAPPGDQKAGTIDLREALLALHAAIPADRVVVSDAGRFIGEAWRIFDVQSAPSFVHTVNFGSIGLGLSQAIGAAVANPDRPTVALCGDGGFMLGGLAEFNTAVRAGLELIVIVCNDGGYGAEHIQFTVKGLDPSQTLIGWPDFAPVAEALGGRGVTVRSAADLPAAAAAVRDRTGPLLIDVKLDPDVIRSFRHG
jgi:thiamine pyrophosphate-dependent acetolactate synthase large subunit-like protein